MKELRCLHMTTCHWPIKGVTPGNSTDGHGGRDAQWGRAVRGRQIPHDINLTWNLKNKQANVQNRHRLTNTEIGWVGAGGEGRWGAGWKEERD